MRRQTRALNDIRIKRVVVQQRLNKDTLY